MRVVGKLRIDDLLEDIIHELFVEYRREHFDATIQVARHHVGTAHVHHGFAAVLEVVDAGVVRAIRPQSSVR